MRNVVVRLLMALVCLVGCGGDSTGTETPAEAVREIIRLYEARDFESLVRTRYAELSKAESEQQVHALIDRFQERYRDEATLNQATLRYRSLLEMTPEITNDGNTATFNLGEGFVKLTRMPNGMWGFHL